jgi:hypothetical protein
MFAWQGISQMALPWHRATTREVADTTAKVIPALRQLAPSNGVYFSRYGALIAVRIAPDHSNLMLPTAAGPMLAEQAAVDFVAVIALCLLIPLLIDQSALAVGKALALVGFAMSLFQWLSMLIWYGFTIGWAAVEITDQTIAFFLTGLVIGAIMQRFGSDKAVAVPDGQGYRSSGGRKTVAR